MLKLFKLILLLTLCTIIGWCVGTSLQYGLDYELDVLKQDCTYTKYITDRMSCIKPEYK